MKITQYAIDNKALIVLMALILTVGGIFSFFNLGQLEDPDFTVKQAVIVTPYPGATPEEVELEVSDAIETSIQEIKELKFIESVSWPGVSILKAEIDTTVWADKLPQVYDELRRKVQKSQSYLPPGAGEPVVYDDYGDVFGFQLNLVGDGFSYEEIEDYAKNLRKVLISVDGVARIDLVGTQQQALYLDVSSSRLAELGVSLASIQATLEEQNMVVDAGKIDFQDNRYRIQPSSAHTKPEDIAELFIQPSASDVVQTGESKKQLLRIKDIGTVSKTYIAPAASMVRYNGIPAIGLSITNKRGVNVVEMGERLDTALNQEMQNFPHGIEIKKMNWQSDAVSHAVDHFLIKFVLTIAIVLLVVWVAMGWRVSIIIGTGLIITVFGTFLLMDMQSIPLHRLSLGALVIALVMMVDNAIVVADGTIVRIKSGMGRVQAAVEAASKPAKKLLGATIIGSIAFAPIFLSRDDTGEYCQALFPVIAGALLLSWFVSVTFTPIQCLYMLPEEKGDNGDIYGSVFYRKFRSTIKAALDHRWLTVGAIGTLFVVSLLSFSQVTQMFFPQSTMNKFILDYWLPEGTRIERVDADLEKIRKHLMQDERILDATAYIGEGPPRFYLPEAPEPNNPSYGQLIFEVQNYQEIENIFEQYRPWLAENFPDAMVPLRRFSVGPGKTWVFEVRVLAPALTDPSLLRAEGEKILEIVRSAKSTGESRHDWRNRVQIIEPKYNQTQGQWTGISRDDVAHATKRAFDGTPIGLYRDGDTMIPILMRDQAGENDVTDFNTINVKSPLSTEAVPLGQVLEETNTPWVDPFHLRYNRMRTIKIQANPAPGYLLSDMRNEVADKVFSHQLPQGWEIQWGGITESEQRSQSYLKPGIVPSVAITVIVLVWLFNAIKTPTIVLLIAPLAVVGMVIGLLLTGKPFGFMALLGAMGLLGMMMKNAIVLLDEVKQNLAKGMSQYHSVEQAAVARLRAVSVTAIKIALGLIPLVNDPFWEGLAVTIIFGVSIGAVLTLIGAPVLYAIFYKVPLSSDNAENTTSTGTKEGIEETKPLPAV